MKQHTRRRGNGDLRVYVKSRTVHWEGTLELLTTVVRMQGIVDFLSMHKVSRIYRRMHFDEGIAFLAITSGRMKSITSQPHAKG